MKAGAVIIIAIAASGALMMRFRKRWLAKINIVFTNRITSLFAGWLPGFGILTHVGRKSGKLYRTPVNVFRASNGFIIALTYFSQSEWLKNVLAADGCELRTRGREYHVVTPKVVRDPTRRRFPIPVRVVRRRGRVHVTFENLVILPTGEGSMSPLKLIRMVLFVGVCSVFVPLAVAQHEHVASDPTNLGKVNFPVSCEASVQAQFTSAVAMLHSFWYEKAKETL